MHTKSIIALTFGVSCLAAPLAVPKDASVLLVEARGPATTGATTAGFGTINRKDVEERTAAEMTTSGFGTINRKDVEERTPAEMTTSGFGTINRKDVEERSPAEMTTSGFGTINRKGVDSREASAKLSRRTGFGIISGGNDDA